MRLSPDQFQIYHGKKYYEPIVSTIEKIKRTLSMHEDYAWKELVEKINNRTEQLLRFFWQLKVIHNNDTTILLPIVLDFIQDLYKTFGITYFYNLSPDVSYEEYDTYPTGQQILHTTFDNKLYIHKHCLIKEDYIMGWSCHHWALIIKKIFDTIDLPGVECVINKQFPKWHAFVTVLFQSRTWVIDLLPQTKDLMDKKMYVMNERQVMSYGTIEHNQSLDENPQDLVQFTDRDMYKKQVLNKLSYDSIKLKTPAIELELSKNLVIYKYRDFERRERVVKLHVTLSKPIWEYTSKSELLQELLSPLKPMGWKIILPLVSKKISEERLFSIFS